MKNQVRDTRSEYILLTESGKPVTDNGTQTMIISAKSYSEAKEIAVCRLYMLDYPHIIHYEYKPMKSTNKIRFYVDGEFIEEVEIISVKDMAKRLSKAGGIIDEL